MWDAEGDDHYVVPGHGRRENALFCSGRYGEYPGHAFFRPAKYNKRAIEDMRTGIKMRVMMSLDNNDQLGFAKRRISRLRNEVRPSVWDMMENTKIKAEKMQDVPRGWRE